MSPGATSTSLAETCRIVGGRVPLWPYHRARLAAGGCDDQLLREIEHNVVEAARLHCRARPGQRFRLSVAIFPQERDARVTVLRRLSSLDVPGGPTVARVDVAEPPALPPGPAKPGDRSYWDDAHGRAKSLGAHQAVLVTPDGLVVDGSTATIWIAEGTRIVTPPSPPAVPGVGRAMVLASAQRAGLDVRVEPVSWERFEAADEAFLTNAFGGAVPVRGRGGEQFERVAALFAKAWG